MSRKVLTQIVTSVIMVLSIKKGEKEMKLVKKNKRVEKSDRGTYLTRFKPRNSRISSKDDN